MSDENKDSDWNANAGISLPLMSNATHNPNLSPLFYNKSGSSEIWAGASLSKSLGGRGADGYYWSSIVMHTSAHPNYNKHLYVSFWTVRPSARNADFYVMSLRCLVSTNNG